MNNTRIEPYLNFNGNCREAMEFYQKIFGGKLDISTFGEFNKEMPEDQKNGVMHSTLTSDGLTFMASDGMPGKKVVFGDSVNMSIAGQDETKLTELFNGLADGGSVIIPLAKQVWGDTFGMLTDKFGIHWLVNISAAKTA